MESRNRRWPSAKRRSNASVLFPEPLTPVTTTNRFRGISNDRFLRLCSRAPWIAIEPLEGNSVRRSDIRPPPPTQPSLVDALATLAPYGSPGIQQSFPVCLRPQLSRRPPHLRDPYRRSNRPP